MRELVAKRMSGRAEQVTEDLASVVGFVDRVAIVGHKLAIQGWIVDRAEPRQPVTLLVKDRDHLRECTADLPRPDLLDAGYKSAAAGFDCQVAAAHRPDHVELHVVNERGTHLWQSVDVSSSQLADHLFPEDVINVFRVLFGREPESADVIEGQLRHHRSRATFVLEMLRSAETWTRHRDLLPALQNEIRRTPR